MYSFCMEGDGVVISAPAKINLALHVTGIRSDGYHFLESLVTFSDDGDVLRVERSSRDHFSIDGPYAFAISSGSSNLVIRARDILRKIAGSSGRAFAIHLTKNLPVSAGIGGGSSDSAAALIGMSVLESSGFNEQILTQCALEIGSDVPMCLAAIRYKMALIARGTGEKIDFLPDFPSLPLVLVNPGIELATSAVFSALEQHKNSPLFFCRENIVSLEDLVLMLQKNRNDLYLPAVRLVPGIGKVVHMLNWYGAVFSRISGSGATCFGIFYSLEEAKTAAREIAKCEPGYFVLPTVTYGKKSEKTALQGKY